MKGWCTALAVAGILAGCNLAPVYDPPHYLLPDSYQGSGAFRLAQPQDALSARGDWWTLFGDERLNQLEDELGRENPTLAAAAEVYTQARDLAAEVQSQLYPQIGAQALVSDNRESAHHLFSTTNVPRDEASNVIAGTASWEPDFWGAIRNAAHAQKRLAQASAADLATARLSLEAELANDYIAVRGYDAELEVLRQSIVAYQKAVEVARLRAEGKIASGLDLARALSQLDSAQAQETETQLQRDLMQHAIAVLVNAMPSSFSIVPVKEFTLTPPQLPAGVPSELLQRRPDIASAERRMAAANVEIGVSRAAFYPNITLSAGAGFEDNAFNLLSLPNSLWSVGAGAMLPLFDAGLRRAELQRSWSQYAQTRDGYRSTVLASFQEVEDGLSLTQRLATEVKQQREASDQATQALSISTMLYEDGLDNYLSVAVAQVTALAAQTTEVQLLSRQMQASVSLIRALGGGWTVQGLPNEKQTLPFGPFGYSARPGRD
ncbi:MAG: efflux transporter outer membrane subunit [Steroidobacteraceae bacterium]